MCEVWVNDFIASLGESDKKYIVENQDPIDYYFSICLYLRNHYIANFTSRGYKIIGDDGRACQGDHFRENYSVTIMYKIIKRFAKKQMWTWKDIIRLAFMRKIKNNGNFFAVLLRNDAP